MYRTTAIWIPVDMTNQSISFKFRPTYLSYNIDSRPRPLWAVPALRTLHFRQFLQLQKVIKITQHFYSELIPWNHKHMTINYKQFKFQSISVQVVVVTAYNVRRYGHYIFWTRLFAYLYIHWKVCEFRYTVRSIHP